MSRLRWTVATADDLPEVLEALGSWQGDDRGVQLHPGDLGWCGRYGDAQLARSLRVWRRDDEPVAVALLDDDSLDSTVVRMGVAPRLEHDEPLARALVQDLHDPDRGLAGRGTVLVEARTGAAFRAALDAAGWSPDESWTPLVRDLAEPVDAVDLEVVEVTGDRPDRVEARVQVQRAAFPNSTFTTARWHAMTGGPAWRDARCLLGLDGRGTPVAGVTVWSAGPGRPGLLEPMGVHRDHRGHGHGRAITVAAAAALRDLGASSACVATPSANVGGVATYRAAGYVAAAPVTDFRRPPLT